MGANLGVLASLMQTMTPTMPQYDPLEVQKQRNTAGTGLIELQQLKEKQAAEALLFERIKQDPALAQQLFGGAVLGSLQTPPGTGPMTQQTTMPGQPPGTPTVIPGGQDLSQFATQGGPPQSVLASLGPQPQGGMAGPSNPALEMARTNPRAAMLLQQQLEGRQDAQMKRQEQNLKLGAATLGYVGQQAQGVTDQASLDTLRTDLQSQGLGKYAAQLPQFYSKDAMAPFIAKALDVKDALTLQVQDLTAQAALIKARKEGRSVDVDNQLRAMGVQPGQETPAQIKAALDAVQQGKVDVSAAQGRGAAEIERTEKPLEGAAAKSVSDLTLLRTMTDDIAALRHDDFTGPIVGRTGFVREQAGQMKQEEVAFRRTVKDVQDILGRLRSGAAIPAPEMSRLEGLAPSVNDPPDVFKSKLQSFQRALEQNRESITRVGTTGRGQLREETKPMTPRVGEQPQGQAPTATGPATFDRADFLKWRQGAGKTGNPTQADVEAYFQARGLKRR